jgi:23S rRNA (uridine2552-2'-O)-methyltransferase
LIEKLAGTAVDLVISDMAPNISGVKEIDQPRAIYLSEIALDLARSVLKPGANFLVKVFQGEGLEAFQTEIRSSFSNVKVRKPRASRSRSREIYMLAKGFTG